MLYMVQVNEYETDPYIFFWIKLKYDDGVFVDFCASTSSYLNLPSAIIKLFWKWKQNSFIIWTGEFREERVKIQKSANNQSSSFGLIEESMDLSSIH